MNAMDLPPVSMATLDRETLDQLFFDIGASTELLEIRFKGGVDTHASVGALDLVLAHDALVSGHVLGVQLLYRHRGTAWLDTLVRVGDEIRLVRIEHRAAA